MHDRVHEPGDRVRVLLGELRVRDDGRAVDVEPVLVPGQERDLVLARRRRSRGKKLTASTLPASRFALPLLAVMLTKWTCEGSTPLSLRSAVIWSRSAPAGVMPMFLPTSPFTPVTLELFRVSVACALWIRRTPTIWIGRPLPIAISAVGASAKPSWALPLATRAMASLEPVDVWIATSRFAFWR